MPQYDVLTLHCPLTADTRNLINAHRLALLPRRAIVTNTARGDIINETILANALRNGPLGGSGADVLNRAADRRQRAARPDPTQSHHHPTRRLGHPRSAAAVAGPRRR